MTDLLSNCPMYLYIGLYHIWWFIQTLPWPAPGEYFGSLIIFIALWYPRKIMEKTWLEKPYRKRRNSTAPPSTKDHQAAASSIGNLFNHH